METLITFILSSYGATMIIVYGSIFNSIRPKDSIFFKCTMCVGFWVGLANAFLLDINFNWFAACCLSSGTSYFLSRLVDDFGIKISKWRLEFLAKHSGSQYKRYKWFLFTIYIEWRWLIMRLQKDIVYVRRYRLQGVRRCCNGSIWWPIRRKVCLMGCLFIKYIRKILWK